MKKVLEVAQSSFANFDPRQPTFAIHARYEFVPTGNTFLTLRVTDKTTERSGRRDSDAREPSASAQTYDVIVGVEENEPVNIVGSHLGVESIQFGENDLHASFTATW